MKLKFNKSENKNHELSNLFVQRIINTPGGVEIMFLQAIKLRPLVRARNNKLTWLSNINIILQRFAVEHLFQIKLYGPLCFSRWNVLRE